MGRITVSSIGRADDTVLISNDLNNLFYLLVLNNYFTDKYQQEISQEKTKLQVFNAPEFHDFPSILLKINGTTIPFFEQVEHVGVLRSTAGNAPTILARMSAHKRALGALLYTGLARSHRANPVHSIMIEKLYATPVLLSGLASLVLSNDEVNKIEKHYLETICLYEKTPRCVVYFLAGSLPGIALLHLR